MHSYIPKFALVRALSSSGQFFGIYSGVLSYMLVEPVQDCSWQTFKHTVDKVHQQVCVHSPYFDIKLLLIRSKFWNEEVERYLNKTVEKCAGCGHISRPQSTHKVPLSSLSRSFNELVFLDHFHLAHICLLHIMDSVTCYSFCAIAFNVSMPDAVLAFDSCWLGMLWPPTAVLSNPTFNHEKFLQYLKSLDIEFKSIPPRCHNMTV